MNKDIIEIMIDMWEQDMGEKFPDWDDAQIRAARIEYRQSISQKTKVDYYFITVNPKPDTDINIFIKLLGNFTKRKPVQNFIYTIEQRGETEAECGKGFHSHILLSWDSAMSKKVRQYAGETFKRIIGSNNNNIININRIPKEFWEDKVDYMSGKKWDIEKETKLKYDKIFRKKNNLFLLYKKDGNLPQEDSITSEDV